jgi:hypothetical protein
VHSIYISIQRERAETSNKAIVPLMASNSSG